MCLTAADLGMFFPMRSGRKQSWECGGAKGLGSLWQEDSSCSEGGSEERWKRRQARLWQAGRGTGQAFYSLAVEVIS